MSFYLYQGSYSQGAIASLVAKPENRRRQAEALIKSAGGKMHSYFIAFGEEDFISIVELPDDQAAAAVSLAASSQGHIASLRTTKLLTIEEAVGAMRQAAKIRTKLVAPKKR